MNSPRRESGRGLKGAGFPVAYRCNMGKTLKKEAFYVVTLI